MVAEEPLLAPTITPSSSSSSSSLAGNIEDPPPPAVLSPPAPTATGEDSLPPTVAQFWLPARHNTLRRVRTAPALPVLRGGKDAASPNLKLEIGGSVLCQASLLLLLYLSLGALAYSFNRHHFLGDETHPFVDSLYFCIVTLCTIGYGDITPHTPAAKALSCIFVLVGFGCLDILLSGAVNYMLDRQEGMIIARARGGEGAIGYIFDAEKGRMRIRMKVTLALGVVVLCIGAGTSLVGWTLSTWQLCR